jgi:hypothetical protein
MNGSFKLKNYQQLEATLELTMTISDWKTLREQLPTNAYPSWKLSGGIDSMIYKLFKQIDEKIEIE